MIILILIIIILLVGVYFANIGIIIKRRELEKEVDEQDKDASTRFFIIRLLSLVTSILIALNNLVLKKLTQFLTVFEGQQTYGKFALSQSFKTATVIFLNKGISPFIIHNTKNKWFTNSGLTLDIFLVVLTINFVSPIINYFDPKFIYKKVRFHYEKYRGDKSKLSQSQANELAEDIDVDLPELYSDFLLNFYVT